MLDKLSLKTKILSLCILMSSLIIVIGYFSYRGFHDVENSNAKIIDETVPNLALVNEMAFHFKEIRIQLRTLGLADLTAEVEALALKNASKSIEAYEEANRQYNLISFAPGEKELYIALNTTWLDFKKVGDLVYNLSKSKTPEDFKKMQKIFHEDCPAAAEKYMNRLQALLTFHRSNLNRYTLISKKISNDTNSLILKISFIGIILSIFIGYIFAQNATKLSKTINNIALQLKTSADSVLTASSNIAASSEELSRTTNVQAASIQQTSSSIEEINSMISANSQNANQSASASEQSLASAENGKEVVGEMIRAIDEINNSNKSIMDQIKLSNKEISDIVQLIKEIGNKTKIINDIVFQTKLLSFNASVEAARAGENGKGFAVVAEEVGKLAAISGAASVEISSMLDNSIKKVEGIVSTSQEKISKLMDESKANIDKGSKVASDCGKVLEEIVQSAASVSHSVAEISSASEEQSLGVNEVTKAIAQLDQVTQENASNAEYSAQAAASLSHEAEKLNELVENLVITVEGRKKEHKENIKHGKLVKNNSQKHNQHLFNEVA